MSSRLRRPAVALLTTTLAASVLGITPAAHAADGVITGTVRNVDGVIVNAPVELFRFVGDSAGGQWLPIYNRTTTNGDGAYQVSVPAGDYRIRFSGDNDDAYEFYGDADIVEDGDSVTVPSTGSVTANAVLDPAAHLTGSVEGPDGALIDNKIISAYRVLGDGSQRYVRAAITRNGSYDLGGLPGGTYVVEFGEDLDRSREFAVEYYQDQPNRFVANQVVVADGATRGSVDAQLELGSEITGRVTAGGGGVVEYGYVSALVEVDGEWRYVASGEVEADGSYVVEGLAADTYRVSLGGEINGRFVEEYWENQGDVSTATDVVLGVNQTATGIDAVLVEGEHANNDPAIENVTPVVLSGAPQVGVPLTASAGTWSPTPSVVTYYWDDGEKVVQYGTSPTYVPTADDLGKTISVYVYASLDGYQDGFSLAIASAPVVVAPPVVTPPVVAPPVATPPVVAPPVVETPAALAAILKGLDVKGSPKVGSTVKITGLDASFRTAVKYKVQWFAGKKAIKKATKSKLKITSAMKGKKISVKVTATAAGVKKTKKLILGKAR